MRNIVVYFPNWAIYDKYHNHIQVSQIPWDKVTVVCHAFFEVDDNNELGSIDYYADFNKSFPHSHNLSGHLGEYIYFKSLYPHVKVLISVGGWTRGQNFHVMASNPFNRATFIQSIIVFLDKYSFIDGIDIDWEFPGIDRKPNPYNPEDRGCPGGPEDKLNFSTLLREIRQSFNRNNMQEKMLTAAVPAKYDLLFYQEPDKYNQYLDFLNVMTYNLHTPQEKITNHHSPLYANPNDPSSTSPIDIKNKYNSDAAMKIFRDTYKVPSSKLNLGAPFYSLGWSGVSFNNGPFPGLFATATSAAIGSLDKPGISSGVYPYFQLKKMENKNGYIKYIDPYAKVPYLYNATSGIMLSYENEESLGMKCDYVIDNNFGGIMVWEISGDDINGFPMMTVIKNKFLSEDTFTVFS